MTDVASVSIFGTGALAMLFGARLARAGHPVTLHGSWRDGLNAIRSRGVEVEETDCVWRTAVRVRDLEGLPAAQATPAEVSLVLVKSHQTGRIAPWVGRSTSDGGRIVTLQNGLGSSRLLQEATREKVVLGTTTAAASVPGPGQVRQVWTGRTILPAAEEALARLLESAGFAVDRVEDVLPEAWLKLAVNCAVNPVSAIERVTNGELLDRPEARGLMRAVAEEVGAVATALGIELSADPADEVIRVAEATSGNVSSMLQDLLRGARTEIGEMSGAVVAEGRRLGVETPMNEYLLQRIRRLELAERAWDAVETSA